MTAVNNIKVSDYDSEYIFYTVILPRIKQEFFHSQEWLEMKEIIHKRDLYTCQLCGADCKYDRKPHVDHIEPLTRNWENRLNPENLQVLCDDCNILKTNNDSPYILRLKEQLKPLIKLKERINRLKDILLAGDYEGASYELTVIEKMFNGKKK
jgi:hypothetical protein